MIRDLTVGSTHKTLFRLAWPMTVGIFAVMGFNIVDTYFVGLLGTKELAAMSFTFPVAMVVSSIAIGMSTALSSMVSRAIGAKDNYKVGCITTDGLVFSFFVVLVLTAIGLASMDWVFRMMGAEGETLELVKRYMTIWYFNIAFVVVPMVGNGAIRATGDTKFPMIIMTIAGVVNAIFDPLLIFGIGPFPRLELEGAAIATVISRAITLVAAIYVLKYREKLLINPFYNFKHSVKHWKEFGGISLPAAISSAINPLSLFFITALVAASGDHVVAGFGVGTRIETLANIVIFGLATGLSPFVGQNFGAGKFDRIKQAQIDGFIFSFCWILFCSLAVFLFGGFMVGLFSDDSSVHNVAYSYTAIIVPFLLPQAFFLVIISTLNAMGKTNYSMFFSILKMLVLYLPLAYLLNSTMGYVGVFVAGAASYLVTGIVAIVTYYKWILPSMQTSQ